MHEVQVVCVFGWGAGEGGEAGGGGGGGAKEKSNKNAQKTPIVAKTHLLWFFWV